MGPERRDGQQRREERHRLGQRRSPLLQQPLEPRQLLLRRVVRIDAGGIFELGGDGVERSVAVVRRAVVAQARMRLIVDCCAQRQRQAGLADAGLPGDQHQLACARGRAPPALEQQAEFGLAPDDGRELRAAQRLEPALRPAGTHHPPGVLRRVEALSCCSPRSTQ